MSQQFIDCVSIQVASGKGGDGLVSWRREKYVSHGGPAGGDGGNGGSVVFKASADVNTLMDFKFKQLHQAESGEKGGVKKMHGKSAPNLMIRVPCGTVVKDEDGNVIGDLTHEGEELLVAQGGRGGRGNTHFISSRRQSPQFAEPGEPGVTRSLTLELKLLADVGLVGLPNAGKSTLLSVLSQARPKIANYPFTTLSPQLGVVQLNDDDRFVLADIPGLIEGASLGQGLGHQFLRHIERTRVLWHLVDISDIPDISAEEAYQLIDIELGAYSQQLHEMPRLVILTKSDANTELNVDETAMAKLIEKFKVLTQKEVFVASALNHEGLDAVLKRTQQLLAQIPKFEKIGDIIEDKRAQYVMDETIHLQPLEDGSWLLMHGRLEKLMEMSNLESDMALERLSQIIKGMGIYKAFAKQGVPAGATIWIGETAFEYWPDDDSQIPVEYIDPEFDPALS